jgi:hypothetical protein
MIWINGVVPFAALNSSVFIAGFIVSPRGLWRWRWSIISVPRCTAPPAAIAEHEAEHEAEMISGLGHMQAWDALLR